MKKLLFFFFLYLAYQSYSQVGIGTSTPRGALDINHPTTNTYGLVLPTNTSTSNILNPRGGAIAPATMIFETNNDCIKYFRQTTWSNCLLVEDGSLFSISKVEQESTFNGSYKKDVAMTATNTYRVGIKNDSPTSVSITLSTLDLKLSGIDGLSVGSVSPATLTILPGATGIATYTITGTPTICGELTGTWRKIKLEHTANITVTPNILCDEGSWRETVSPEYRLNGLITGESYSGTYTIPYDGDSDCPLVPETITQDGLTLTFEGGDSGDSGEINYILSGTYTGDDNGAVTFITAKGCTIYLGPCRSCKEIIEKFPGSPDGVYRIDPDREATGYPVMSAQCDMTTDGGGWTMVLNYLHLGGTNPANSVRFDLPIIGSSTLGVNEATNIITWGHANRALQLALAPTQYRFYGITSAHSRVMHFKTAHAGSVSYFTRGTGSVSGIQSSFTALAGHTANLPAAATAFYAAPANSELIGAPFYRPNTNHWLPEFNRWEMDDFNNGISRNTLHRVWVR